MDDVLLSGLIKLSSVSDGDNKGLTGGRIQQCYRGKKHKKIKINKDIKFGFGTEQGDEHNFH